MQVRISRAKVRIRMRKCVHACECESARASANPHMQVCIHMSECESTRASANPGTRAHPNASPPAAVTSV
eukprot:2197393-Pyramimonas_sp.AAC.1